LADPYLSVVVPCYNESENLCRGVLDQMQAFLRSQPYAAELIVSDDGSRDDSRERIQRWLPGQANARLLENEHGGKPWAVWQGIQAASGEIVLFADMDQSTPISQVARLLPCFEQGYDVVIGSRGLERSDFPFYRRLGSRIFREFRRLFLLRTISDTQCGFKVMRTVVARELFPKLQIIREREQVIGWKVTAFDVELLHLAERAGYRIAEVRVAWADRDVSRGKGKSYLVESREMASQVLRVKLNEWRGYYDRA
jgi:dolichyl-phosphate beta-glucosyltransferase